MVDPETVLHGSEEATANVDVSLTPQALETMVECILWLQPQLFEHPVEQDGTAGRPHRTRGRQRWADAAGAQVLAPDANIDDPQPPPTTALETVPQPPAELALDTE